MHLPFRVRLLFLPALIVIAFFAAGPLTGWGARPALALTNCNVSDLTVDSEERAFLTLINNYRAQNGAPAAAPSPSTSTARLAGSLSTWARRTTSPIPTHSAATPRSARRTAASPAAPARTSPLAPSSIRRRRRSTSGATPRATTPTCSTRPTSRSASPAVHVRLDLRLVLGYRLLAGQRRHERPRRRFRLAAVSPRQGHDDQPRERLHTRRYPDLQLERRLGRPRVLPLHRHGAGSNNLFGQSMGTNTSIALSGFPRNGQPVYVRLWTRTASGWQFNDYSYRDPS